MNLRNKKLINTLVAAFVVVVMAGSAFAFVNQGALVFEGTANVNASLELTLVSGSITRSGFTHSHPVRSFFVGGYHDTWTGPARTVSFVTDFDRPGQYVHYNIVVENTGTIPARLTGANFVNYLDGYLLQPGHSGWYLWGARNAHGVPLSVVAHLWSAEGVNWSDMQGAENFAVLKPGDTISVRATVRFLTGYGAAAIEDLGIGHELQAHFVSTLSLDYGVYLP